VLLKRAKERVMAKKINLLIGVLCLSTVYVSGQVLAMGDTPDSKENVNAETHVPTDSSNASDKPKVGDDNKAPPADEQSVIDAKDRADTTGGIEVGDRQPATNSRGDVMNTKASGQ
jgi:hypothetical protein